MSETQIQHLKCRLYFFAVLPCLETLVSVSPEAREVLKNTSFSLCFKTISGLRTCLSFEEGRCHYYGPRKTPTAVELLFVSERQAVRTFEKKWAVAPMPTRGISRLGDIKVFKKLTEQMEAYLQPQPKDLENESFRAAAVEMLLAVALGSACQLGAYESYSKAQLEAGAQGVVAFQLPEGVRSFWLRFQSGNMEWGRGESAVPADVSIRFSNMETALGVLQDTIVAQAEVGTGNIRVDGLVPLADQLGLILERIPRYLEMKN